MNNDDEIKTNIFGFGLNNTAAAILFYVALISIALYIPVLFREWLDIYNLIGNSFSIDLLLAMARNGLEFFILSIIFGFSLYFLVMGIIAANNSRNNEDPSARWLFFRLTRTSLPVLLALSLIFLLVSISTLPSNFYNIINYFDLYSLNYKVSIVLQVVMPLIMIPIHIYTLIICITKKNSF